MRKKLEFLRKDILIQKVLLSIVVLSMLYPLLLAITLPLLGLWQVTSGSYHALKTKELDRIIYLFVSTIWMIIMISLFPTEYGIMFTSGQLPWFGIIYIIIPLVIAVGYLKYSIEALNVLEEYAICQF